MSKLLIVDDELDIREFAKNFFEKRNTKLLIAMTDSFMAARMFENWMLTS